jgi:RsiW-degrading membrane proteinase PrsW (M82 family)
MKIFFEMKTQSVFELRDARKLIRQGKRVLFTTGVIEEAAKALLRLAGVIYWERMPRELWRKAKVQRKG